MDIRVVKPVKKPDFKIPENSISTHFFENKLFVLSEAYPWQDGTKNELFSFSFSTQ